MNLFGHPGILATKVYQTMLTARPHTSDVALSGRLRLLVSCLVVTNFYAMHDSHGLINSPCRASVTKYVCNTCI